VVGIVIEDGVKVLVEVVVGIGAVLDWMFGDDGCVVELLGGIVNDGVFFWFEVLVFGDVLVVLCIVVHLVYDGAIVWILILFWLIVKDVDVYELECFGLVVYLIEIDGID